MGHLLVLLLGLLGHELPLLLLILLLPVVSDPHVHFWKRFGLGRALGDVALHGFFLLVLDEFVHGREILLHIVDERPELATWHGRKLCNGLHNKY